MNATRSLFAYHDYHTHAGRKFYVGLDQLFKQAQEGKLKPVGSLWDVEKAEALRVVGLGPAVWGQDMGNLVVEGVIGEK